MPVGEEEIRNRFGYHQGTSLTVGRHERVREAYIALAEYLDALLPDGRAKSTAFTKLQESSMWANFGVAEQAPLQKKIGYTITDSDDTNITSADGDDSLK